MCICKTPFRTQQLRHVFRFSMQLCIPCSNNCNAPTNMITENTEEPWVVDDAARRRTWGRCSISWWPRLDWPRASTPVESGVEGHDVNKIQHDSLRVKIHTGSLHGRNSRWEIQTWNYLDELDVFCLILENPYNLTSGVVIRCKYFKLNNALGHFSFLNRFAARVFSSPRNHKTPTSEEWDFQNLNVQIIFEGKSLNIINHLVY